MAEIFVTLTHQDPPSAENVGFRFHIKYEGREMTGDIEVPSGTHLRDTDAFRTELARLAEAIGDAVNSPSGIIMHSPGD